MAVSTEVDDRNARKRLLRRGRPRGAVGVIIAGTANRTLGGVIVVAGWLIFVYALHAFGRTGTIRQPPPEEPKL